MFRDDDGVQPPTRVSPEVGLVGYSLFFFLLGFFFFSSGNSDMGIGIIIILVDEYDDIGENGN